MEDMREDPLRQVHVLTVAGDLSCKYAKRRHKKGVIAPGKHPRRRTGVPGGEHVNDIRPDTPDGSHHPGKYQRTDIREGEEAGTPDCVAGEPVFMPHAVHASHGNDMEIDIVAPGEVRDQFRSVDIRTLVGRSISKLLAYQCYFHSIFPALYRAQKMRFLNRPSAQCTDGNSPHAIYRLRVRYFPLRGRVMDGIPGEGAPRGLRSGKKERTG
jgi:hypothetical protein